MSKTDAVVKLAHKRTADKVKHVKSVIQTLQEQGEKITFYSVQKAAGVSKSFIYNNADLRELITGIRDKQEQHALNEESAGTIIQALKAENKRLQDKLHALQLDGLYKEKYQDMVKENAILKQRVDNLLGQLYEQQN